MRDRSADLHRVLMTVDAVGGVWRYAVDLAAALKDHGGETLLVGLGPRPTPAQVQEAQRCAELEWLDAPLDWTADGEDEFARIGAMLEGLAERKGVTLLHLNLPSLAARISPRLPTVVVSHSCVVTWWQAMRREPLPQEWRWQKRRNAAGFARADAIVTPSASQASLLRACYGDLPRIRIVPNATASRIHREQKSAFVLAAGRWWDEGKGGAVLDAAAARFSWPVLMAGAQSGSSGQHLDIRYAQAAGEIGHDRLLDLVSRAGIVVSPSFYEPFGLVALEGARGKAALVLSDIATYRELWDEAALFFMPGNAKALASAVNRLVDDVALRTDLAHKAWRRSLRFTPRRQAEAMCAVYADTLLGHRYSQTVEA